MISYINFYGEYGLLFVFGLLINLLCHCSAIGKYDRLDMWAVTNDSYLLQQFMREECKATDLTGANPVQCSGIDIFQPNELFFVNDSDSFKFFEKRFRKEVLDQLNNTVTVRINNRISKQRIMGNDDAYDVIARKCCPLTYKALKDKPF